MFRRSNRLARRTLSTTAAFALCTSFLVLAISEPASADGVALNTGDVLAATGAGLVKHFSPAGSLLDTLDTTTASTNTTGMCFDTAGNVYVTNFASNSISKFDANGNLVAAVWASAPSIVESCTFNAAGDMFVGGPLTAAVYEYDTTGTLIHTFSVTGGSGTGGSDWVDLEGDQCTLLYTGESSDILSYNVCTSTQNPDFASGLPGKCFALRVRPNGDVLVTCQTESIRFDKFGNQLQTYTVSGSSELFAMNLDPNNMDFWTGDIGNGDITEIDIATGAMVTQFNSSPATMLAGLAIYGEISVAQQQPTTLTVNAATGDFNDPTTVSGTLTVTSTSAAVAGKTVSFTLNGTDTCSGVTDASGIASCTLTPTEASGPYTLQGTFAGDSAYLSSTGSATFTVTTEETAISYTGSTAVINGQGLAVAAHLTTDDPPGTAVVGRSVLFTLGSGGSAQTCSGTTDAGGNASCTIAGVNQAAGPVGLTAAFAGDTYFQPSSTTTSATVVGTTGRGLFVVGDVSASAGGAVQFWGAKWAKHNTLSGGPAPRAMKGYADNPASLTCGSTWTTHPGNSSHPAATLPALIAVIVSTHITRHGNTISGDILHIDIVQPGPGYGPNPGHAGTGTIIGSIC
jgi:hypothetical protein